MLINLPVVGDYVYGNVFQEIPDKKCEVCGGHCKVMAVLPDGSTRKVNCNVCKGRGYTTEKIVGQTYPRKIFKIYSELPLCLNAPKYFSLFFLEPLENQPRKIDFLVESQKAERNQIDKQTHFYLTEAEALENFSRDLKTAGG